MSEAQPVDVGPRVVGSAALTRTQRLIWASQRLHPEAPLANMGKRFSITGGVDPERFVAAFDAVVQASDTLRMVVDRDGDRARILHAPPAVTGVVELARSDLDEWCAERIATPIDATRCVYDSVLLRHGPDDWTWWLDLHHVATDAWASTLVFEATSTVYVRLGESSADRPDLSDVVDGSFFPAAEALEADPGGRDTPGDRAAAWERDLDLVRPVAPLEPYGTRGARTTKSERVALALDAGVRDALDAALDGPYRSISRELGLLALAAMSAAVTKRRLDGRSTLLVGVPVHHRSSKRTRRLLGPLMELVPLVVEVDDDEPATEMFARVLRSLTELLRRAKPGESPDAPFEVVINVLTARYGDFAGLPTTTEWMRSGHVDPAQALRLQLFDYRADDSTSGLQWELDINTALSVDGAEGRLPRHLGAAVAALVERPEEPTGSVVLVDAAELTELAALTPAVVPRTPAIAAHERVRADLRNSPDRIAVVDGDTAVTAADFDQRIDDVAHRLVEVGVRPGDAVGLRLPRGIEVLVAIQAVLRCGGHFVMLDPDDPPARHELIASDAGLRLVLDELPEIRVDPSPTEFPPVDLDAVAYVLYTSGSTGTPKGVPISHRGLADYLQFAAEAYVVDEAPVMALHSSLVFDLTITSLFLPLMAGGTIVVIDGAPLAALAAVARDDRVNLLKATPSQLELLARMADRPMPIRTLVVGGEAFRRPVAERIAAACEPGVRIFNEYGPTEAVVGCMVHEWSPDLDRDADVPIGHACPGGEIRIVDPVGHPSPVGVWGELYVRRPGMAQRYLHRPELSAERFVELDPVEGLADSGTGARWYRTGDRARVVRPGVAVYGGRNDDQLKVNGIRLEPAEVESALVDLAEIDSALVRLWRPSDRAASVLRCRRCGLGTDVPDVRLDDHHVCNHCRTFDEVAPQTTAWFRTEADLDARLADARRRRDGGIDALHLLSGGKDSTYALYQLVERGWNVHALTLDNGFISDGAKENIRRSIADLGITHEFATTAAMNEIFRDSLERYSNVCQGCYKTIYTIAVHRAREMGIPVIVTGLSRGQFFETRLVPHQFETGRFDPDEIDQTVLEARRVYHRTPDAVTELLPEQRVFDDLSVLDQIEFVDFYRYVDVDLAELYRFLEERAPWVRPADTGRSTNCLINVAGIQVHRRERGFHNYAEPYSWDVRLGHKTREEALEELDDVVDDAEVARLLAEVGYEPKTAGVLTAWYTTHDGADLGPAELRQRLRDRLPDHAVPSAFVHVDEMPLAASAKADPSLLPAPMRFHRQGAGAVAPSTPTEERLCQVWCEILGLDVVGVTDDFFDLGGASLDALEVVAAIDAEYGTDLHDAAVFRARTVRELATVVDEARRLVGTGTTRIEPYDPTRPAPLSPGEEAMLFEHRLAPERTAYNVTRRYRIETGAEGFDSRRFADSVRAVAAVHGPLHTAYDAGRTVLPPPAAVAFEELEAMSLAEFDRFADRQRRVPFDLERGPLVRVHAARLDDGAIAVLIGTHHISIDAGTFDLFWDQIVEHYDRGVLPQLAVSYADHAAWQRSRAIESAEFWLERSRRRQLGSGLALAAPSPPEPDGYLSRPIDVTPAELAAAGPTPFAVAMAAAAVTYTAWSGRHDVEFGATASTKDHPDVADVVGYYLNALPLSVPFEPGQSMREVIAEAGEVVAEAIAHRSYPLADIIRDARAAGLVAPDVSLMLAYERLSTARFPGGRAEHRILAAGTSVADVTLFVQERHDAVQLGLEYRGATLSRRDATRLLDTFDAALRAGARSPGRPAGDVVAAESELVGEELAAAPLAIAAIVDRASSMPDARAVVDAAGATVTYRALVDGANELAERILAAAGSRPRRVGVVVGRSAQVVSAMLGVQLSGGAYVPIDPAVPVSRREVIFGLADLDVLLVDDEALVPTTWERPVVVIGSASDGAPTTSDAATRCARIEPTDPAYVIFTSGSTGTPRGVEVTHASLAASTAAREVFYDAVPARFLVTSSIGFDSSMVGLVWPLVAGGTVVVPADADTGDVDRLGELIARLDVTHLLMVPSLYRALLDRCGPMLGGVRTSIVAGEACPAALVRLHEHVVPTAELVNEYGPTEATVWATAARLQADVDPVPIGRPIAGVTLRIVDDRLRTVPAGVAGELLLAGPGVVAGYLGGERADAFVELDGRRWYRTGDLGRIDDGAVIFLGRIDDQLNVGGVRIEPAEVEAALRRQPGVDDAVVVAAGDPALLVAHLEGDAVDEAFLRTSLAAELPPTAVPRRFVVHDALPRSAHGKLDRHAAQALPVSPVRAYRSSSPAATSRLDVIIDAWRTALGRDDIDVDTDFFEAGGDSLSAVEIVATVESASGQRVPIAALLTGRTPVGMAEVLGWGATLDEADDPGGRAPTQSGPGGSRLERLTLRPGSPDGPLIVMTPAWDEVFSYQGLARSLDARIRVEALVDAAEPADRTLVTVADIVDHFVEPAREAAAGRAGIALFGWSVGGVVAAELADRLSADGVDVTLLAMVDTFFPGEQRHLWSNRWWKYRSMLRPGGLAELGREVRIAIGRRALRIAGRVGARLVEWSGGAVVGPTSTRAATTFPPESLDHPIGTITVPTVLYRASATNPARTIDKWQHVVDHLDDVVIDGRHRGFDSIMGPDRVDEIAYDLGRRLRSGE